MDLIDKELYKACFMGMPYLHDKHPRPITQHLYMQLHDGRWQDLGEISSVDFEPVVIHGEQEESDAPNAAMDMPDKLLFGA